MDRKVKFRSRKLEYGRPLGVYRWDEALYVDDYGSPLRAVPLVATGVDREEEDEHHLQAALTASQVPRKEATYVIPTPEAANLVPDYDLFYPPVHRGRKGLVRHAGTIEDLTHGRPGYTADAEDMEIVGGDDEGRRGLFEHVMSSFEEAVGRTAASAASTVSAVSAVTIATGLERVRTDPEVGPRLAAQISDAELAAWLVYWQTKRTRLGAGLVQGLRFEDTGRIGSDPYVCFRRRELKQPRKTRRSDAQIMDKVRRIRYDLQTLRLMLVAGCRRDRLRREALIAESAAFERFWTLRLWQQHFGIERPPTLPSFRAFHQQLPMGVGRGDAAAPKAAAARRIVSGRMRRPDASLPEVAVSGRTPLRIVLPPVAIRTVPHSRPYYPFEVVKQMQRDVGALLAEEHDPAQLDLSADLGLLSAVHRQSDLQARLFPSRLFPSRLFPSRTLFAIPGQNRDRCFRLPHTGHYKGALPNSWMERRARGGRVVLQSSNSVSTAFIAPANQPILIQRTHHTATSHHLRSIQARDCAHLNNAFVGNYNQHYIQATASLTHPTSLLSWVAATAGLVQGGASRPRPSTSTASPSKKRKTSSASGGGDGEESKGGGDGGHGGGDADRDRGEETDRETKRLRSTETLPASDKSKTSLSSLASSPQFTVKVKPRPAGSGPLSQSLSSGSDPEDRGDGSGPPTSPKSQRTNAARFTPTGLATFK